MRYPDSRIVVFAKAPVAGSVKTRLIPHLGANKAAQLHEALTLNTIKVAVDSGLCPVHVWAAPDDSHVFFKQLCNVFPIRLRSQIGNDLGERMFNAYHREFIDVSHVVLAGSDCATMNRQLLEDALFQLHNGSEAVISPAEDGGYVLMGLKKNYKNLFVDMPWGKNNVYAVTLNRFNRLSISYSVLEKQWDIDRPEDVVRLKNNINDFRLIPNLQNCLLKI